MEREQEEEGRGGRLMKMVEERKEKIENRSENDEEKEE